MRGCRKIKIGEFLTPIAFDEFVDGKLKSRKKGENADKVNFVSVGYISDKRHKPLSASTLPAV
jgi:hypothetical protein